MTSLPTDNHRWWARPLEDTWPPYGEQAMKDRARIRDLYRCRDCSMPQDVHLERFGRKLPVHHIYQRRDATEVDRAHVLTNLVTLCERCHRFWDGLPTYLAVDRFLGPYLDYPVEYVPRSELIRLVETLADYGPPRLERVERRLSKSFDWDQWRNKHDGHEKRGS